MTKQQLNEMVLNIAIRDMNMTHETAGMWLQSAGVPHALGTIAQFWWVHEIGVIENDSIAPDAAEVRRQLKHLASEGYLLID